MIMSNWLLDGEKPQLSFNLLICLLQKNKFVYRSLKFGNGAYYLTLVVHRPGNYIYTYLSNKSVWLWTCVAYLTESPLVSW